ncbi:MAG TPA: hypothetical protein VK028_05355 [Micromonosporaceae bacterium]|nr:hypothetical protein [Micromonosporaceae bacterium]
MSGSAELTHDVLLRVAEFLRKLPAKQLEDLAAGTARLQVVERPDRQRLPKRSATPKVDLPKPIEEIGATLGSFMERAAATAYLDDLHLTVAQLRSLAAGLGIAVPSKATKAQARDTIVQWTVGRRADAAILSRPTPSPRRSGDAER